MTAASVANLMVEALLASTLLIAAVMAVRVPVRRAFGPGVAYALWALPPLRLLLPPLPAAWHHAVATPISRAGETITILVVDPASTAPVAAASSWPSMGLLLGGAWSIGALGLFGWHFVNHRRFCRRLLAGAQVSERREGVTVITSHAAAGPLAFGILRRYVAFPADFVDRYDTDERDLALAHELGHHQRGDLLANWAALGLLAVHWWNPLAWHAFRAFRADQELANDARVLAGRNPMQRHAYACAIIKAAHGGAIAATCHLHTIKDLKGRLSMLKTSPASRRRLVTGGASIALLTVAGLGLTASGTSAATAINDTVKASTGVDLQLPAPPPPPAPIATDVPAVPGRNVRRVMIVKDGKATSYEGAAADAYIAAHPMPVPPVPPVPGTTAATHVFVRSPDGTLRPTIDRDLPSFRFDERQRVIVDAQGRRMEIPEIAHRDCPGSDGTRPVIIRQVKDGKQLITVCTNRIAAMSRDAERMATNGTMIAQNARRSARGSLAAARASIEADRTLTDAQRRSALDGIADAEKELSSTAD